MVRVRNGMKRSSEELRQKQSLPLGAKIRMSQNRIKQWYEYWDGRVYVAFSGGKDSTVLLHLVRELYPEVPAVFCDTGLEFPEVREFVKGFDNVVWLKPRMGFRKILKTFGYPVISKEVSQQIYEIRNTKSEKLRHKRLYGDSRGVGKLSDKWKFLIDAPFGISGKCCNIMKKRPSKVYEKLTGLKPYLGNMVVDSQVRQQQYYSAGGCNSFAGRPQSAPLSFWFERDIWEYIRSSDLSYSEIYDKGYIRTGCVFCLFGIHYDSSPNRFQRMKETHPKLWKYSMETLGLREVLKFIGVPCEWRGSCAMPEARKGTDHRGLIW